MDLRLEDSVCHNLNDHFDEEISVQQTANTIFATQFPLSIVPGLLISFFAGPWSDINGRKPLLIMPLVGDVFSYLFLIFYALEYCELLIVMSEFYYVLVLHIPQEESGWMVVPRLKHRHLYWWRGCRPFHRYIRLHHGHHPGGDEDWSHRAHKCLLLVGTSHWHHDRRTDQ